MTDLDRKRGSIEVCEDFIRRVLSGEPVAMKAWNLVFADFVIRYTSCNWQNGDMTYQGHHPKFQTLEEGQMARCYVVLIREDEGKVTVEFEPVANLTNP